MASNVEGKEMKKERFRRRRECDSYRLRRATLLYDVHICIDWLDAKSWLEIDMLL